MLTPNNTAEDTAIREYILQKMNGEPPLDFIQNETPFDVPAGHLLHGKKMPFEALKDQNGCIYTYKVKKIGEGGFAKVYKGEVFFSTNPELEVGTSCAIKKFEKYDENSKENTFLKLIDQYYGHCLFEHRGEKRAATIMRFIPGIELGKAIDSYKYYKLPSRIDSTVSDTIDKSSESSDSQRSNESNEDSSKILTDVIPQRLVLQGTVLQGTVQQGTQDNVDIVKPMQPAVTPMPVAKPEMDPVTVSITGVNNFDVEYWIRLSKKLAEEVKKTAHDRGIVHRDIKPDNFKITEDGEVRLLDVGVAEHPNFLTEGRSNAEGTWVFMAPECFLKPADPSTPKQDVYSLGRTFELLIYKRMQDLYPDAYKKRPVLPDLFPRMRKETNSEYLNSFYFDNPDNKPDIEAINDYLKIIHQMKSIRADDRPDINQVIERLSEIERKYEQRVAMEKSTLREPEAPKRTNEGFKRILSFVTRNFDRLKNIFIKEKKAAPITVLPPTSASPETKKGSITAVDTKQAAKEERWLKAMVEARANPRGKKPEKKQESRPSTTRESETPKTTRRPSHKRKDTSATHSKRPPESSPSSSPLLAPMPTTSTNEAQTQTPTGRAPVSASAPQTPLAESIVSSVSTITPTSSLLEPARPSGKSKDPLGDLTQQIEKAREAARAATVSPEAKLEDIKAKRLMAYQLNPPVQKFYKVAKDDSPKKEKGSEFLPTGEYKDSNKGFFQKMKMERKKEIEELKAKKLVTGVTEAVKEPTDRGPKMKK